MEETHEIFPRCELIHVFVFAATMFVEWQKIYCFLVQN